MAAPRYSNITQVELYDLETKNIFDTNVFPTGRDPNFVGEIFGFADDAQPTYGYFGGGGFDFGQIETAQLRADEQSYSNYENAAATGGVFVVTYRNNTVSGDPIVAQVTMQINNPNATNYVPPISSLTYQDLQYEIHDQEHAATANDLAMGKITSIQQLQQNIVFDEQLVAALQKAPANDIPGGTAVQEQYATAYKNWILSSLPAGIAAEKLELQAETFLQKLGKTISQSNINIISEYLVNSSVFSPTDPNAAALVDALFQVGSAAGVDNLQISEETTVSEIVVTLHPSANQTLDVDFSQNGLLTFQTTTDVPNQGNLSADVSLLANFLANVNLGSAIEIDGASGASVDISQSTGAATVNWGGQSLALSSGGLVNLQTSQLTVDNSGDGVGIDYTLGANGGLQQDGFAYSGATSTDVPTAAAEAAAVKTSLNTSVQSETPSESINDSLLSVSVAALDNAAQQSLALTDPGPLSSNLIYGYGGASITDSGQGSTLLNAVWSSLIAGGYYRPGYQMGEPDTSDLTAQTNILDSGSLTPAQIGALVNNTSVNGLTLTYLDPLLIDLTGDGINVSNWINNDVYFDDGVNPNNPAQADGELHHTSWAEAGTGMLALDPTGGAITNITQLVSEFLDAGPTPGQYTDGLAALAALTQAGASSFSAATSLIDPATGQSYWSEMMVWNDANQNGVTDSGELESLNALGITSISLEGSGNDGATVNGNAITNTTTYTKTDGTEGSVEAVSFQTDALGEISTTASGGIVIQSLTEGGPTQATTFVSQAATAQNYIIRAGGLLEDATTGQTVMSSGISAVLSSTQNDVIQIGPAATGTYWIGGGTGADTLYGGANATTVFLVNPSTVVHGGTGANSFNIAKVIGTAGVNIDMAADNLQEVIGGDGGDIINASGTSWNVFIQAGNGNNIIIGGEGTDAISGGAGDDLIEAGPGGSDIHAGSGNDLIYGGSGAALGIPSFINAGASTNAGFVERLYNGGLGREADQGGFNTYVDALNNGTMSEIDVATAIAGSAEWQSHYGTQTDAQFVTSIFQGLLGRPPSASELSQFTQALAQGATRGQALETVATNAASLSYWGDKHPGASDVIFGGSGNDIVQLGTNNSEVLAGTGSLTVIGNANGFSVIGLHDSYADYTLTHNADGTMTLTDSVPGSDGPVTFNSSVTALDFSDISQVPVATGLGMPVDDQLNTGDPSQVTVSGSGQYVISAATLLANDKDYSGKTLSIRELLDENGDPIARGSSGQVNGGTASLSADGSTITFTPAAGFTGVMSFRYHVEDSSGQDGMSVVQLGTTNTAEMTATVYLNTPVMPTDPLLDSEWFLQAANVLPVWNDYTGAGVSVGVFDPSGSVDFTNADLAPNAGQSINADGTPGSEQIGTHATLVAGVIGAADNGTGAIGVAYGATINSVGLGIGTNADLTNILDWKNYDVVNNSWGDTALFFDNVNTSPGFQQAFYDAASEGRNGLGTAIVFAGGNSRAAGDNTNYHSETNSQYAIVVGGINAPSDLGSLQISGAPFSNPGASILVSAPANNISSTGVTYTNAYGQAFGADEETAAGTSFAAPIVSGVIALMLQANPNLGYRDIQKILAYSAVLVPDPSDTTLTYNGADNWNGGGLHTSENYGFGEVDALAAVRLAETWQFESTTANEEELSTVRGQTSATPTAAPLNFAIPSAQGVTSAMEQTFTFSGALDVEHADVELNLAGIDPNNLIVELISPSGVVSTLVDQPPVALNATNATIPENVDFTFDSVRDYGETSAGTWTVEVAYAPGTTPQGTIAGIALDLYGSQATGPQVFIYTDEFAGLDSGSRQTLQDPSGYADTINAAAVTGVVDLDLRAGSTDSTIDGKALDIGSTTRIDTAFLGDGGGEIIGNNDGDRLIAGRGAATLIGGNGNNTFYGGGANDYGTPTTHDVLTGGSGQDLFYLGTASATVNGGAGFNTVDFVYAPSAVTVNLMTGTGGGAAAGDTFANIQGFEGSDYNDTVAAWGGMTLDGGAGSNTLDYSTATDAVTVDFADGTAQVGSLASDTITNFQNVIGSAYDDYIYDGPTLQSVDGGGGDANILDMSEDPDGVSVNLMTGTGTSGYGNAIAITNIQYLFGALYHSNNITGGIDTVDMTGSLFGGDTFTANNQFTAVDFEDSFSAINVNLATDVNTGGAAQGDILNNVEYVVGSQYNDTLTGNAQNNTFDGYLGNDTITGGGGYDTYFFAGSPGYGQTVIINGTAANNNASGELDLGFTGSYDVTPQNIWLKQVGNNLQIDVLGTTTTVTLQGWFANAYNQLRKIVGSDGSILETNEVSTLVQQMASYQTANPSFNPQAAGQVMPTTLSSDVTADWSTTVTGTAGNDILAGVNRVFVGNGGDDTYRMTAGQGGVEIVNGVSGGASGQITPGPAINPGNLWFSSSDDDLLIQMLGSTTRVAVDGWFDPTQPWRQLTDITFTDGSQIGAAAITDLAAAMDAYEAANPTFDAATAKAVPSTLTGALQTALNADWSRTITGRSGALTGYYGDNTYAYGSGYGAATVVNGVASNPGPTGTLQFTSTTVTKNSIWLTQVGNNLQVDILGTTDSVTLENWFTDGYSQVRRIVAGDGSIIETRDITLLEQAMASYQTANPTFNPQTAGQVMPSSLTSQVSADWLTTLNGTAGNDSFTPGATNENLVGGGGDDTYFFPGTAGQDNIVNGVSGGPNGTLELRLLSANNVWFSRSGNDLIVQIIGGTGSETVQGWFDPSSPWRQLANIQFFSDDSEVGTAGIGALVSAMANYQAANPSFNAATAAAMPTDPTLQAALNIFWARTFTGQSGTITGNFGNNTYSYGTGFGSSTIVNGVAGETTPTGTLDFTAAATTPDDIWLDETAAGLKVSLMGSTDSVTISGWTATGAVSSGLSTIGAGGSTLANANIQSLVQAMATFESNYSAANNGAIFNPASTANPMITDPTVLAAANSAWHHAA